jgi:hypothetical protein
LANLDGALQYRLQYEAPNLLCSLCPYLMFYLQNNEFWKWSRGGSNP